MDPDANLAEQRFIVSRWQTSLHGELSAGDASRLAELSAALDGWLTNGGTFPEAWRPF